MLILQGKFQGSRWYRAAMLFALAVTGGTGFAQQQSYVDPSGQVLFASDETSVAIEFDSLLRRLEETEHRLRLLEARQGSMPGESSESGWDLHSATLQTSTLRPSSLNAVRTLTMLAPSPPRISATGASSPGRSGATSSGRRPPGHAGWKAPRRTAACSSRR